MAKISRFATTRIAASLNADLRPDENVKDSFYLDGRIARKREKLGADITSSGEDRGFFYAIFATHDLNIDTPDSDTISTLHNLTETIKTSNDKIDNEINDLADCAVEVGGRATIAREGVRQSYFAGIIVKEAEIAAVTTGGACTFLYRNNALYPLTGCDIDLVNADYHGNAIENMNDFSAGVAGTIRYSNIAQLQAGDVLILCNKEVLEALGQRDLLKILYNYDDCGDAAAEIIDRARSVNEAEPLQAIIASVEEVIPADRTGKINLGLFQSQKDLSEQETTRYEPIKTETKDDMLTVQPPKEEFGEQTEVSETEDPDDPFKPSAKSEDEPFTPSFMTTDQTEDTATLDYEDLEEQEVSQIDSDESDDPDDNVPVFEPIVTSKYDQESDAFTAGREYADDDYYAMDKEAYDEDDYDDEWQDDRSVLAGNRNQDYDDDYYDDYDMYSESSSGGSKAKQYALYIALGIVCIACVIALYFMLVKKDDSEKDTDTSISDQIEASDQADSDISVTTQEADIRTPIKSDDDTEESEPADQDAEDQADTDTVAAGDTVYVTADILNMRDDASTEGEIIAMLSLGDSLTVGEEVNGWYSVTAADGTTGYVNADYVSTTAP